MEVTVLEAQNTPKQPVIAVRAGTSLRHAEMALNKPFRVALNGLEDRRIKISLYEQLGTQTIPDGDQAEAVCNVPVRTPDGKCSQVKLRVRRGPQKSNVMNNKNHTAEVAEYLNNHQLEARIQSLFEIVLKKQPEDPWRCMIQELQKLRRASEPDSSSDSKAPVAPSEPKPANARPSPGGKRFKQSQADTDDKTKAAVAQVRKRDDEPYSATKKQRDPAAQANAGMANEVVKLVLRQVFPTLSKETISSGNIGKSGPFVPAMEHSKAREIALPIRKWAYATSYSRIQAQLLGLMGGGHTDSDYVIPVRDAAALAEHRALTACVKKAYYNKAYWAL